MNLHYIIKYNKKLIIKYFIDFEIINILNKIIIMIKHMKINFNYILPNNIIILINITNFNPEN